MITRRKFFKSLTLSTIGLVSCKDEPAHQPQAIPYTEEDLFYAIAMVESNHDNTKVGQDGEIGMYQITRTYVHDVNRITMIGGVPVSFDFKLHDRTNLDLCRVMMSMYWQHYATFERLGHKPTFEDKARIHNGGPDGWKKASTLKYWHKVKTVLERI